MGWTFESLDHRVDAEIAALPAEAQADFLHIAGLIERNGLVQVGMPYIRHLEGKLWEMRLNGRDVIARAICTAVERRVIVLHVFVKKTQKTPKGALELARKRVKEVKR
jgi:phage-related protein